MPSLSPASPPSVSPAPDPVPLLPVPATAFPVLEGQPQLLLAPAPSTLVVFLPPFYIWNRAAERPGY